MLQNLSIENFRIFKEKTNFDLRPFTILTGPNNSGKSSLIKFLLLLKEGVLKLNFEHGNHNLENFKKVINLHSKSEILKFRFDIDKNYSVEFIYESSKLTSINFFLHNILIFEYVENLVKKSYSREPKLRSILCQRLKNFNIKYLIDIVYDSDYLKKFDKDYNLTQDYMLYEIYVSGENMSEKYKDELKFIQHKIFKKWELNFQRHPYSPHQHEDSIDNLRFLLNHLMDDNKDRVYRYFKRKLKGKEIEIEYTKLGEVIFGEEVVYEDNAFVRESFNCFNHLIVRYIDFFNINLDNLYYLSANRGSQKRVLRNKSDNDIDEIILQFIKSKIVHSDFINKAFKILGIKGKIKVERLENVVSSVYLETGNNSMSLADLGYGYSQVIPIILKINNIYSKGYKPNKYQVPCNVILDSYLNFKEWGLVLPSIILEEPESNLHPDLQSKLADVLVLANEIFDINFLIETHSEYFIRKLQYLTAKKKIDKNSIVIYYFNSDENVTPLEKKVKEIKIDETGSLSDSFGPGFFDESTKLQFELMKINKDQKDQIN